jgi:hypothetical protein
MQSLLSYTYLESDYLSVQWIAFKVDIVTT